jgi:ABC-type transport system substrate-binding protein
LFLTIPALLLAQASVEAQPQPAAGTKVERLVMGLITPFLDYMRPWINGIADHNIQHDPVFEWLFEIDAETGQYVPWLANSWQLSSDGKAWRITLQKGVQFHHGYGEFTAMWYTIMPYGVTRTILAVKIPPLQAMPRVSVQCSRSRLSTIMKS